MNYFGFTLVRSLNGSENSHLDQSDAVKTNHDLFPRILLSSRGLFLYSQIFLCFRRTFVPIGRHDQLNFIRETELKSAQKPKQVAISAHLFCARNLSPMNFLNFHCVVTSLVFD